MRTFDGLFEAHGARIFRFCFRLCGNKTDAEDLTQDVFVAAWQSLPRFAGRSTEQTWLYRIALYRWNRVRQSRGPETVPLGDFDGFSSAPTLTKLSLDAAIDSLPADLRAPFLLVKAEGLTHKEAAHVLEIPTGTVQSRVFAAARRLRELLSEEEEQRHAD